MLNSDDFFCKLTHQYKINLPFVAYRKPNSEEVNAMLQNNDQLDKVSDYSESGFVFAPFDDREDAIIIPSDNAEVLNHTFNVISYECEKSHKENSSIQSKEFHINLVQKGIDSINSNHLVKVVLSRAETVELSETRPIHLFNRLLQTYLTAFVYCWYHPKVGLWLGASPETLLRVEGNRYETMALAGTQLDNGNLDMVWRDKEKEEQQLVTNYIVSSLQSSAGSQNINVSEVKTVKAGNLLHLQTNITGTLNFATLNFKNFLTSLHPTPAICGIPRDRAKQFILKNENYNREFYSGFLGELNFPLKKMRSANSRNVENQAYASIKKVSNIYVNLRCVKLRNNEAMIYVGGGITKDSNPENEWVETVNKTNTIKKVLS